MKVRLKNPLPWRTTLTAVYLFGLAVVGFWPSPVDKPIQGTLDAILRCLHSHGVPRWFDYNFVEASANVVMFIPFGLLIAITLPSKNWWQLTGVGLMASTCMELGQLLFISARFASLTDLVTNTSGAFIGISLARLVVDRNPSRRRRAA
ncbi:VanZ family protein [Paenarthrobacter nicotinovorans]|uniref:VanZ family protein n=1 Tax=Paenarthrobacter nicotinovorans TaxID=29320 RepID=UPI0028CBAC74|nr:VanZ family protein [Paenarthrobacter nicotinovorans]